MILSKLLRFQYQPSIKFPKREHFSGKTVKLTNREALNQAMSE